MKWNTLWLLVVSALLGSACEEVVDIPLKDAMVRVVIEGNLTDQLQVQSVKLSHSLAISDETDNYPPISNARVTITDHEEGRSYDLLESTTARGIYQTVGPVAGLPGRTYTLEVQVGNQSYKASSTMPHRVNAYSLREENGQLFAEYTLPSVHTNNKYRLVVYSNDGEIDRIFLDLDKGGLLNNAKVTYKLNVDRRIQTTGNQLKVVLQAIDDTVFHYFRTLSAMSEDEAVVPSTNTAQLNPISNFNNGALGYFSAHTVQTAFWPAQK